MARGIDTEGDLPDYEILGEIGSGSFGVVLRARQQRLGRLVAIKQLSAVLAADDEVRRRFVSEARILSGIDHPHVVPVFDFVDRGDACLLIMELLTGGSLAERRAREALTVADVLAVGLAACSGLDAAHASGVLHRDIKPANLLFASSGALKIVDFGIAKMIGGGASLATVAGTVLGSASFMAPEQVLGDPVSPATDVYALATVLYESLSGQLPFPGDRTDQLHLLMARVERDPVPLGEVAAVPPAIAEVVMRAVDRRAAVRPPTAEAFGVELAGAADAALGPGWLRGATTKVYASGALLEAIGPALKGDRGAADDDQERWAGSGVRRVSLASDAAPVDLVITGVRDLVPLHEVLVPEVGDHGPGRATLRGAAPPWVAGFRARVSVAEAGVPARMVVIEAPTLVGRDAEGLPLADLEVSRRHCVLAPTADGVVVTDLRSSNGTFVRGEAIDGRATARPGDDVRVGATTLTLLDVEPIVRRQLQSALQAIVDGALAMTGASTGWLVDSVATGVRVLAAAPVAHPDGLASFAGQVIDDPALGSYVRSVVTPVSDWTGAVPLGADRIRVPLGAAVPTSRLSIPCVADQRVVALLEVGSPAVRRFDDYVPFVAVLAGVAGALLAPDPR